MKFKIKILFTSNNQYFYIVVYLQSEQFIARNTKSVDKDVDMVSISIMIPWLSFALLLQAFTASSMSKLTQVPPLGVCLGIVLESSTKILRLISFINRLFFGLVAA